MLLVSCNQEVYHQVTGGEFTVNFSDQRHIKKAEELATYFRNNGLLTGERQDIGLFKEDHTWNVCLIATENSGEIGFETRKLLLELRDSISSQIFQNEMVSIHLTDNKFKVLHVIE